LRRDSTYNILFADAFKKQVDEVTLYIFDIDVVFVKKCTNALSSPVIRLTDLRSGNYHFVACAQSKQITSDQSYLFVSTLKVGISSIDELTYRIKREASGIQRHELNNFPPPVHAHYDLSEGDLQDVLPRLDEDLVLNGPFGDVRAKQWGDDCNATIH